MKPLFTIVTTTYNCGSKIDLTWESLASQDFTEFEYLIIDGNSRDGTQARLASIKDSRVRFCSEPDQGIYDAMNKGIGRARGRYLYFLGAGDTLFSGVLQEVSRYLPPHDHALLYGNVQWGAGGPIYDGRFSRLKLCRRNICHQAIFYGREVFTLAGNYNLKYRVLADWAFNLKCFGDARITAHFMPVNVARFELDGVSSKGDPAFEADKATLIRNCLGETTYVRYRIHLWKEHLLVGPRQMLKTMVPQALLDAKRKISDRLAGRC